MKNLNVNMYTIYVYEDGSAISIDDINDMNEKELDSLIHIAMAELKYRKDVKYKNVSLKES